MLQKISQQIKQLLTNFPQEDKIIFNNKLININKNNFQPLPKTEDPRPRTEDRGPKTLTFIDGGQAEIISAANFSLSFIRIFAQLFNKNKKTNSIKNEFYLFTYAKEKKEKLYYLSKIFPVTQTSGAKSDASEQKLIEEEDLLIDSNDETIREGLERAPLSKITSIARRFAELSLAAKIQADHLILDGTLTPTYHNEKKYLEKLPKNTSALAKTSQLFTTSGNSPLILLAQIAPKGCWSYFIENKTYLVKLHNKAKHVFRFEGNKEVLPLLAKNSQDPLFLGYPYGLIFADKFARLSNTEKNSLKTKFLLNKENKEIFKYLSTINAHHILDNIEHGRR